MTTILIMQHNRDHQYVQTPSLNLRSKHIMKQFKKYLCLALLLSAPIVQADECSDSSCSISTGSCNNGAKTIIVPLTQLGSNLYTQYHEIFNPEDDCSWEARLSATYRFAQTYKGCDSIAPLLFGSNTLAFKGSTIKSPDNATSIADTDALLADYFGMGKDTNTSVTFNPQIRNNIIDFQFSAGGEKLWFQVNVPLMNSRWKLNDCGKSGTAGTADLQKASTLNAPTTIGDRAALMTYVGKVGDASSEDLLNDDVFDNTGAATNTDFPTGTTDNAIYG